MIWWVRFAFVGAQVRPAGRDSSQQAQILVRKVVVAWWCGGIGI
jgi:hypothetical protein